MRGTWCGASCYQFKNRSVIYATFSSIGWSSRQPPSYVASLLNSSFRYLVCCTNPQHLACGLLIPKPCHSLGSWSLGTRYPPQQSQQRGRIGILARGEHGATSLGTLRFRRPGRLRLHRTQRNGPAPNNNRHLPANGQCGRPAMAPGHTSYVADCPLDGHRTAHHTHTVALTALYRDSPKR